MGLMLAPIEGTPYVGGNAPGFQSVSAAGLQVLVKSNLSATSDPTASDDSGSGYRVGSRWTNTATGKVWEAVSVATLAAVWKDLTATTPPAGSGTEFQYRASATSFGAITGSSFSAGVATLPTLAVSDLTATRFAYVTTSGRLVDSGNFTTDGTHVTLASASMLKWSTDTGAGRNASGIVEFNNGTAGQYRDVIVRSIGLGVAPAGVTGGISGASVIRLGTTTNDAVLTLGNATLQFGYYGNGTNRMYLSGGVMYFGSQHIIGWSSTNADATTGTFTALARNAEGVIEVNNGTANQYRDILVRSIGLGVAPSGTTGGINGNVTINAASGRPLSLSYTSASDGYDVFAITRSDNGAKVFGLRSDAGSAGTGVISGVSTVEGLDRISLNSSTVDANVAININSGNFRIGYSSSGYGSLDTLSANPIALQATASGGVVIGGTTASAKLHVIKTTEQLRLGYNATNYFSTTVASNGDTTFAITTGTTTAGFSFSNPISCPGAGVFSERFGAGAASPGNFGVAVGNGANAAIYSIAVGYNTVTTNGSTVVGHYAGSAYAQSIVLGQATAATAANQLMIGSTTAPINAMKLITDGIGGSLNFGVTSGNLTITPSGGKVGIGAAPGRIFHVTGTGIDASGLADVWVTGTGTIGSGITLDCDGSTTRYSLFTTGYATSLPNCCVVFDTTNGVYRTVVTSSGKFGINTTAPDKQVEINSATGDCLRLTYNDSNGTAAYCADFAVTSAGDLAVTPSGYKTTFNGRYSGGGQFIFNSTSSHSYVRTDTVSTAVESGYFIAQNGATRWGIYTPASSTDLRFSNGSSDVVTIASAGTLSVAGAVGTKILSLVSTATNDDPQLDIYQNRVATTDATVTTLHTIAIADETAVLVTVTVLARRTGGVAGAAGDSATYVRRARVKRTGGGIAVIGTVDAPWTDEDQAGWDCTIDVDGGNNSRVRVTGAANNNVTWHLVKLEVSPLST